MLGLRSFGGGHLGNGPKAKELPQGVLLHVPKTGGTSLNYMIQNAYPANRAVVLSNHIDGAIPDKGNHDFISGHFRWSFVEKQGLADRRLITFFRDPVSRALSQFYFMKMNQTLDLFQNDRVVYTAATRANVLSTIGKVRDLGLSEFLDKEPDLAQALLGNWHTWILSEDHEKIEDLDKKDLDFAKSILDRCHFVGICERMDESLEGFARSMGWPFVAPHRENTTKGKRAEGEHSPKVLQRLREITALDNELYQHALKIHKRQIQNPATVDFPLPDATKYTPADPILGGGWYTREGYRGECYCWTGPSEQAFLLLKTAIRTSANLTMHLLKPQVERVTERLALTFNGQPLDHLVLRSSTGIALRARVSETIMEKANGRIWLGIHTGPTTPVSEMNPGSMDPRKVGVCLLSLNLAKVTTFWGQGT
jgi:hypothetical protein